MSELAQEIQAIVEAEQPKTQEVTTETVTPETTETPSVADEKKEEAAASKTFTEDEVKAQLDAEAAKIRNKYERKMERLRIESETRTKILNEQQQQVVGASEKPKELLRSYYCKTYSETFKKEFREIVLITLDGGWQTHNKVIAYLDESAEQGKGVQTLTEKYEYVNGVLRSLYSIIERKGKDTNWEAIGKKVKEILEDQSNLNN